VTADRHNQNSNQILTVTHCGMSVPDTRGETEDGAGRAEARAGDVGVRQMAMMGMELGKLTMEGGGAGVW